MMIVTTTGRVVDCVGPFSSDFYNSDAKILEDLLAPGTDDSPKPFRRWVDEMGAVLIADRGFLDAKCNCASWESPPNVEFHMPGFIPRMHSQLESLEANKSRLVTKVRWVVEAVNARMKKWRFLAQTVDNSCIHSIASHCRIVCALLNCFRGSLTTDRSYDADMAATMRDVQREPNCLKPLCVDGGELASRRAQDWMDLTAPLSDDDFPHVSKEEIFALSFGSYQFKFVRSYISDGVNTGSLKVQRWRHGNHNVVKAAVRSRHSRSKMYKCWILFVAPNEQELPASLQKQATDELEGVLHNDTATSARSCADVDIVDGDRCRGSDVVGVTRGELQQDSQWGAESGDEFGNNTSDEETVSDIEPECGNVNVGDDHGGNDAIEDFPTLYRTARSKIAQWYCSCRSGERICGMCAHAVAVVWFVFNQRLSEDTLKGRLLFESINVNYAAPPQTDGQTYSEDTPPGASLQIENTPCAGRRRRGRGRGRGRARRLQGRPQRSSSAEATLDDGNNLETTQENEPPLQRRRTEPQTEGSQPPDEILSCVPDTVPPPTF